MFDCFFVIIIIIVFKQAYCVVLKRHLAIKVTVFLTGKKQSKKMTTRTLSRSTSRALVHYFFLALTANVMFFSITKKKAKHFVLLILLTLS